MRAKPCYPGSETQYVSLWTYLRGGGRGLGNLRIPRRREHGVRVLRSPLHGSFRNRGENLPAEAWGKAPGPQDRPCNVTEK